MITANVNITNMLTSPVRKIDAKVEFYLDSTLVETCHCNDKLISFSVERIGDTSKFFGFGICQKLNVHIMDKDRELSFSTANDIKIAYGVNGEFIYPYPTFHISEVRRDENTNELSITAYDLMYPDTAHIVDDIILPESYNPLYFVSAASVALKANGVSFAGITDISAFQVNYEQGANFEGHETIREALNDVAEITQTIYYIDNNDSLVFKRLDKDGEAALNITKSDYITLESRTNRRLGAICHTTELGDNLIASIDSTGTTQYIRDNAFWSLRTDDIHTLMDKAIALVGGLTLAQFDCGWRGNFLLEIGDKIALTAKDDTVIETYVLDDVFTYNGSFTESTQWAYQDNSNETAETPTSIGDALNQTFAKVDKVNKEITLQAGKIEELDKNIGSLKITTEEIEAKVENLDFSELGTIQNDLASLKITSDNITQEVHNMEENLNSVSGQVESLTNRVVNSITSEDVSILIEQRINDGVNEVITDTGYVFNKDGLTISKSGSEMSTLITEDGMTVFREDIAMLSATSDGVNAVNLHATTYLLIGETSRFEDFNDKTLGKRTGCFWVGMN